MSNRARIVGLLTARSGSKGIPGKNLASAAGKPLIYWSILAAQQSGVCDALFVSTDGADIADYCRSLGVDVPFLRPQELSTDEARHLDVMNHAMRWLLANGWTKQDFFLLLQPTSPLRTAEDIRGIVDLVRSQRAPGAVSVRLVKDHPFWCNRIDAHGQLEPFFPEEQGMRQRQECEPVYVLNGALYLCNIGEFLREHRFIFEGTKAFVMPSERSQDVDSPFDLAWVDFLLTTRNPHLA